MYEATATPVVKKPAHENLYQAIRALKFPGRMTDEQRDGVKTNLALHCMVRKNDIIPNEVAEQICQDLFRVAMNAGDIIWGEIWDFVVSQMGDEDLAIILLDDIATDFDEGWVVICYPSGAHVTMTADSYDHEQAEVMEHFAQAVRESYGDSEISEPRYKPVIARVGPTQESGQSEVSAVEEPPIAASSGVSMPAPEDAETPTMVDLLQAAEADDTPAEEEAVDVPAASD